jgi:hypothetical protein
VLTQDLIARQLSDSLPRRFFQEIFSHERRDFHFSVKSNEMNFILKTDL